MEPDDKEAEAERYGGATECSGDTGNDDAMSSLASVQLLELYARQV